jgi:hypothetical protein
MAATGRIIHLDWAEADLPVIAEYLEALKRISA